MDAGLLDEVGSGLGAVVRDDGGGVVACAARLGVVSGVGLTACCSRE